jgi:lipoate-protein ligase B
MTYNEVDNFLKSQKKLNKEVLKDRTQAEIELAEHIEVITNGAKKSEKICVKSVRDTRKKEAQKSHIDYVRGIVKDEQ